MRRALILMCLALAVALVPMAGAKSGGTISVDQSPVHWGDTATFSYTLTDKRQGRPYIIVNCANGAYYEPTDWGWGPITTTFTITADAATMASESTCSASLILLGYGRWFEEASTSFPIYPA